LSSETCLITESAGCSRARCFADALAGRSRASSVHGRQAQGRPPTRSHRTMRAIDSASSTPIASRAGLWRSVPSSCTPLCGSGGLPGPRARMRAMRLKETRSAGEGLERSCQGTVTGWLVTSRPAGGVELFSAWFAAICSCAVSNSPGAPAGRGRARRGMRRSGALHACLQIGVRTASCAIPCVEGELPFVSRAGLGPSCEVLDGSGPRPTRTRAHGR